MSEIDVGDENATVQQPSRSATYVPINPQLLRLAAQDESDGQSSRRSSGPPSYAALFPVSIDLSPFEVLSVTDAPTLHHGLEPLRSMTTVHLVQQSHPVQTFCGCDMPIQFSLTDRHDTEMYRIREQDNFCIRNCIPGACRVRSKLYGKNDEPMLNFVRKSPFPAPFSRERLTVYFGDDGDDLQRLGTVQQVWALGRKRFRVLDAAGTELARISGPRWNGCGCGRDVKFEIGNQWVEGATEVGSITRHWSGLLLEMTENYSNYTVRFPRDMDVTVKATLLGAVYLIHVGFFHNSMKKYIDDKLADGGVVFGEDECLKMVYRV
ncbi:hypothetical protein quinque_012715 [Culex quinquefasciatus]